MNKDKFRIGIVFFVLTTLVSSIVLLVAWNWLVVSIFELRAISFIEAIGLNLAMYAVFKFNIKVPSSLA
jgi:hypothetical protein